MINFCDIGKGWNIWDTLTHFHPDEITDRRNGDVACDSYHKYKEDVKLLKELGVSMFSYGLRSSFC